MPTQTPNYQFDIPNVGGDKDTWGGFLNGNWTDIDTLLQGIEDDTAAALAAAQAAQNTADGALQRTGGTMTGNITLPGSGTGDQAATVTQANTAASNASATVQADLDTHKGRTDNPHSVTPQQIGALPLSGGTLSGVLNAPELHTTGKLTVEGEVVVASEQLTSAATINLNMTGKSRKLIELDHNANIVVAGGIPNQSVELIIQQGTTGGTATFSGVTGWIGGVAPVLTTETGQSDLIILITIQQGNVVYGQHVGSTAVPV